MTDLHDLLTLISELTTLLAAAERLADMVRAHNATVQRIQKRLDDLPTQC